MRPASLRPRCSGNFFLKLIPERLEIILAESLQVYPSKETKSVSKTAFLWLDIYI